MQKKSYPRFLILLRQGTLPGEAIRIPYPICPTPDPLAHYELVESKIYAIESLDKISNPLSWIIKVQELGDGQARIIDALSRTVIGNMAESSARPLYLMDYKVTNIATTYELLLVVSEELDRMENITLTLPFVLEKVIVSDDFDVMVMHSGGWLTVWRRGDSCWTELPIDNDDEVNFQDAMYYNKKFYAVDFHGRTISVDCKTLAVTPILPRLRRLSSGFFKYLIRVDDCFHLIVKFRFAWSDRACLANENMYPVQYIVYKLGQEKGKWTEKMDGFQDRVFCVCDDGAYSFLANEFPATKGNSVYFNDSVFRQAGGDHPGCEAGICNLSDYTSRRIADYPGYSGVFWPPPNWLWWTFQLLVRLFSFVCVSHCSNYLFLLVILALILMIYRLISYFPKRFTVGSVCCGGR